MAAGAVMTTGDQTIAGAKTFSSTIVGDINGNIVDANGNEIVKGTATDVSYTHLKMPTKRVE